MSTDLREVMHERAHRTHPGRVDLAAVVRIGDQRRRRRAYAVAGAGVAVVAAVGSVTLMSDQEGATTIAPAGQSVEREPSYATGSIIHHGDQTTDVSPHRVQAYVQTGEGYVFTDSDGVVRLATGSGLDTIGQSAGDGWYLQADDTGSLVAWIDDSAGVPELVVYDTAVGAESLRTSEGFRAGMGWLRDDDPAFVYALDDGVAYVRDGEGAARVDIETGERTLLHRGAGPWDLADVANGLIAHEPPSGAPDTSAEAGEVPFTMLLGTDYSADGTPIPASTNSLSPDAGYAVTDFNDSERIFDVATGTDVTPKLPDYGFIAVAAWTSDDTAALVALDRERVDLLECDIPAGTCAVVAADIGPPERLQLPTGEHLGS